LTVPRPDEAWLSAFARGFFELADRFGVQLVGGDTTRGPLTVTVQVQAWVPKGQAVRRSGARPGDVIFVTGTLGDAGLALRAWQKKLKLPAKHGEYLFARLNRPTPRCAEGEALRGLADAMIDVSDGLAADLGHILEASGVGATLDLQEIPLSKSFIAVTDAESGFCGEVDRLRLALSAGDDYELCFAAPAARRKQVQDVFSRFACGCRAIGVIESALGLRLRQGDGTLLSLPHGGFDHFNQDRRDEN
jgi:thiamine-monophosphate kinase